MKENPEENHLVNTVKDYLTFQGKRFKVADQMKWDLKHQGISQNRAESCTVFARKPAGMAWHWTRMVVGNSQ
ncbi:MAG: hypothetical protein ACYCYP_05200 [Leptospirales bacterium]